MRHRPGLLFAALAVATLVSAGPAAAVPLTISLDTSPLVSGLTGPYYLDFQLIDGDGMANTVVQIGSFGYGGGGVGGPPDAQGDASGDIGSTVQLGDSQFFNGLFQPFLPGGLLSFVVDFTSTAGGATPDSFSFSILNAGLFGIGGGPAGELLSIDFGATPAISTYAGTDAFGDPLVGAPSLVAVPEPATMTLLLLGLAATSLRRRGNVGGPH